MTGLRHRHRVSRSTREVEISHTLPDDTDVVVTCEVSVDRSEQGRAFDGEVLKVVVDAKDGGELPTALVAWDEVADKAIEAAGEDEHAEAEEADAREEDYRDDDGYFAGPYYDLDDRA